MLQGINVVVAIVSVCCYLFVIYKMFENAETVIGIVCLVGVCVLGIGGIVAFVYGWIKSREWEIVPVMAMWSGALVLNVILAVARVLLEG